VTTVSLATQISGARDSHLAAEPSSAISSGSHHLAQNQGESSHESKISTARVLPDPTVCRAKSAGFGDYADCLVEHPLQCRCALRLGDGFLCLHPQRNEIVMRTSANGREFLAAHLAATTRCHQERPEGLDH
jgi:hypothetical protein